MIRNIGLLIIICFSIACGQTTSNSSNINKDIILVDTNLVIVDEQIDHDNIISTSGKLLHTRFRTPKGYERILLIDSSFSMYLRQLPLKSDGSEVLHYDGSIKPNYDIYDAVVDLEIGKKDLHQCADAIMRLKAEYHWERQEYEMIHFNFTNGFRVDYSEWMKGKRIVVKGNKSYWNQKAEPSTDYKEFWSYLEIIFSYAGTLSLSNELESVNIDLIEVGDLFIQGGSPGHAILVVDMAIDNSSGRKIFLLAQSYMPAQEIQILTNPNDESISPWYSLDFGEELITPEWTFYESDLKRFRE